MTHDLRLAIRLLRKNPAFTAVAVLVLALGIGANTAIFAIVNAMMLEPIASEGRGIVGVYAKHTTRPDDYRAFSWPSYQLIRQNSEVFSDLMAFTVSMMGTTEGDVTRRSFCIVATANYFSTLGARLAAGRTFTPEEERPQSNIHVVIVGHQFARKSGVAPADVIGRRVRLNAQDFTIVGVTPEGFSGTMALMAPEFWLPIGVHGTVSGDVFADSAASAFPDPANRTLMLVGRLRDGLDEGNAGASLSAVTEQLRRADPDANGDYELLVRRLPRLAITTRPQEDTQLAGLAVLLMSMAGLVLLVACLNLANMLLARGTARRKEIAVRLALGAGRARVVRQLLMESLLLALTGAAAGLLLSMWGTRLLVSTFAAVVPMVVTFDATPDIRVLGAAMTFALVGTVVAGLVPAWRATRPDILPDLKEQAADFGVGRRFTMRNLLVVGQVAISLALLTAAGLFTRGAIKASVADPGFPLDGGIIASIDPGLGGYDEPRGRSAIERVLQRVRSTPGVSAASIASLVPFGEFQEGALVQLAGTPRAPDGQKESGVSSTFTIVGADYFETLRLPILRGRGFTQAEESSASAPKVAVIDEPLARRLFADQSPLGRRVQFVRGDVQRQEHEVVGVVSGVRHSLFDSAPTPHAYVPSGSIYRGNVFLHARVVGLDPKAMLETLRREIRAVDAGLPVANVKTLEQHRDGSVMLWAVNGGARLFSTFGIVALLLAAVGVYGVRSYVVSRRTREIGIRMALGASSRDVLWLVLRDSLALTLVGLGLGLLASWAVAKALSSLLYDVDALDPAVFAVAPLVLGLAAMAASYLPARRATRVVPLAALRVE